MSTVQTDAPEAISYTVQTAARIMDVCENTIWNLLRDGKLTRHRFAGRTVVLRSELLSLLIVAA